MDSRFTDLDNSFSFTPRWTRGFAPAPSPGPYRGPAPAPAAPRGLLARTYGAVDRFLPGDSLFDPMFGAAPAGPGRPGVGGLAGGLRIVDDVLGLGVGEAIDRQRARGVSARVRSALTPLLADATLTPDQRIGKARQALGALGAEGHDVSSWLSGLSAIEALRSQPAGATVATD